MPFRKLILVLLIVSVVVLFLTGASDKYLDIHLYQDLYRHSPVLTLGIFFIVFLLGTGFSLPVAGLLTTAGGVVFGTTAGFFVSLVALTLGGTVAQIGRAHV